MPANPLTSHPQKMRRLENGAVASVTPSPVEPSTISIASSLRHKPPNRLDDSLSGNLTNQVGLVMSSAPGLRATIPTQAGSGACTARFSSDTHGMRQSLAELDAMSHAFRLSQAAKDQNQKGTGSTYNRHVRHYTEFWDQYQAELSIANPSRASIPSFPITAAKVAMFLQHESTREKVSFKAELARHPHHTTDLKLCVSSSCQARRRRLQVRMSANRPYRAPYPRSKNTG
jgi:hypothetical protein